MVDAPHWVRVSGCQPRRSPVEAASVIPPAGAVSLPPRRSNVVTEKRCSRRGLNHRKLFVADSAP